MLRVARDEGLTAFDAYGVALNTPDCSQDVACLDCLTALVDAVY
jgi:hypothetical protein